MIIGRVVGNLWSTVQEPQFAGTKLLLVQPLDPRDGSKSGATILAVDAVSAGVGDLVLVVYEGSSSRLSLNNERTPCEAIIAGLVDEIELDDGRLLTPELRERGDALAPSAAC
jgi:ethanolamine utilization protein EutN